MITALYRRLMLCWLAASFLTYSRLEAMKALWKSYDLADLKNKF